MVQPKFHASKDDTQDGNVVPLRSENEGAENRVSSKNALSTDLTPTSTSLVLSKIDKATQQLADQKERERIKARRIALGLITKKKTINYLCIELNHANIPVKSIMLALIKVAEALDPDELATSDTLNKVVGDRPEGVSVKWWRDEFPELLDKLGITVKKSRTERRFNSLSDLQCRCNLLISCVEKTGDVVISSLDRLAKQLLTVNPYIEQNKNGELVVHEKPAQTHEGKEAKRKAELAAYLAKQRKKEASYVEHNQPSIDITNAIDTYKKPALVILGLMVVLYFIGEIQPQQNPNLDVKVQQGNFNNMSSDELAAEIEKGLM